ncbi:MAG: hypothetical protein SGI98_09090 [Verrucomicrobiota bacterium]|nr:hypothetical protein [Verrucomicrobiota bacterium]
MADQLKLDELLNLEILPDWTKSESGGTTPTYNEDEIVAPSRREGQGGRPRRDSFTPGNRQGVAARGGRDSSPRGRSEGRPGDRPRNDRDRGPQRDSRGPRFSREEREPVVAPQPVILPNVEIGYLPIEGGLSTVAKQIKGSFKAFPVFDIARLFLDKPERQDVKFQSKEEGLELFQDLPTGLLFTKQSELVTFVLKNRMEEYFTVHKNQTEAPKGNFSGVAKCKLGGELLGPPNHHAYLARQKELFLGKYSKKMSFDQFRTKIEIIKDEENLNKWKELESWKIEYQPKDQADDVPKLGSLDEVEKYFKENILPKICKKDRQFTVSGTTARKLLDTGLRQAAFQAWEAEVKFPIKFVNEIRPGLVHVGLHIFKNRKNVTVVNSAKPKFFDIDLATVSSNISHIIATVREQSGIKLKNLVQHIPFTPPDKNKALAESATVYFDPFEGLRSNPALQESATVYFLPEKRNARQSRATQAYHENSVLADLLWLVHEGYVIEFFDGSLEIGKKNPPQLQEKKEALPVKAEADVISIPTAAPIEEVIEPTQATVPEPQASPSTPVG